LTRTLKRELSTLLGVILALAGASAHAQPAPLGAPAPPEPAPAAAAGTRSRTPASHEADPPTPPTSLRTKAPPAAELVRMAPAPLPETGSETITAGWHGAFYIRDANDYFRIYPKMRAQIDFQSFAGPRVGDETVAAGGNALKSRLFLRRLLLELGGEFLKRWTFYGSVELSQVVANANGQTQIYAAPVGQTPAADSARFQAPQTAGISIAPDDAWVGFAVAPWLNLQAGHFLAPFSMENRTSNKFIPFMERHLGIRAFALSAADELGLMAWGEIAEKKLSYEVGVFAGEGANRPQIDDQVDFFGRVFAKPLLGCKCDLPSAQIGVSARHGDRNPAFVDYDYAPITSAGGFRFWNSVYTDSRGRPVHVLPSGAQNEIGGELRLPMKQGIELRGEAYYVANNTREAVEGFLSTNTERLGQIRGVGWYAQLSGWPFGDAYVNGDPGIQRPTRVDFSKPPPTLKRGLELLAVAGGINASYDGASRGGAYDAKTPGNPSGKVARDITVYELGLGLSYWHTSYVRTSLNYLLYYTPGSGSTDNLARVPGNTVTPALTDAHLLHEISARAAVSF